MSDAELELDAVLRALSDATRRRLYVLVAQRPGISTAELAARVPGMTRWGVMKHISVLRQARLLQTLPEGRRRRHYHEPGALGPLNAWLVSADSQSRR
jgi:DNA-binding transcriptional ArsR family regulator